MSTNKYKKLGTNIALITVGSFASRLLGFLFVPFYTSILTTDQFGIADLIATTVSLLFPIFTLVICEAMMRFALEKQYDNGKIWVVGVWVWAAGFLVLLLLSPLLKLFPVFSPYLNLLLLYYISYSISFNASYYVRGIENIKLYAASSVFQTVFTVGFNLLFLLWLKLGLEGYLLAYIMSNFLTAIILVFGARLYKVPLSFPDKALLTEMLAFSIPLIPHQIGWWINKSVDKYFLIALCGTSVTGLYSIAHKIPSILYVLISIFSSAWRISAVDEYGTEENVCFYNNIYDKYLTVSIVGASFLITVNKIIAHFLYAKEFYTAYIYVPFLILAVLFNGLGDFVGSIYITYKRTTPLMLTTLLGVLINIVLNALLIPHYKGIGASIATMVGFAALWLIRLINTRTTLPLEGNFSNTILCLCLLVIQAIIWLLDVGYSLYFNILASFAIVFLRKEIISIVFNKIRHI